MSDARRAMSAIDYDLHGVVGIRLVDARASDAAAVARQLGPMGRPLAREPDIVIRFVEQGALHAAARLIGLDDAAFTEDAFLLLRGKHKSQARVSIPMDRIGGRCEIVCQTGVAAVPLLVPIANLTALARGLVPVHASAFTYRGRGALVTGWSKGGKTELLLAFMARGAQYVGDEWVWIMPGEDRMVGIPEPIRVWPWHLRSLPAYRARLGRPDRARLRTLDGLVRCAERALAARPVRRSPVGRAMARLLPLLKRQACADISPHRLFDRIALCGKPDVILFAASHQAPGITVHPIDAAEVARRIAFSLDEERQPFLSCYRKFRFAFPDRSSAIVETASAVERARLPAALQGKPAYAVYHPYPVSLPRLFDAVQAVFARRAARDATPSGELLLTSAEPCLPLR